MSWYSGPISLSRHHFIVVNLTSVRGVSKRRHFLERPRCHDTSLYVNLKSVRGVNKRRHFLQRPRRLNTTLCLYLAISVFGPSTWNDLPFLSDINPLWTYSNVTRNISFPQIVDLTCFLFRATVFVHPSLCLLYSQNAACVRVPLCVYVCVCVCVCVCE